MTTHCVNLETVTASSAHAKSDLARKKNKVGGTQNANESHYGCLTSHRAPIPHHRPQMNV